MKSLIEKLEWISEVGGTKRDIVFLIISAIALALSIFKVSIFPFDLAWVAIVLCGFPIIIEAVIGLVTEFDIKADVLVSLALIASICIREDFAAGEVAFIMQLGALLEEFTVSKAREGIEKLVHLTPRTARVVASGMEKIIKSEEVKVGDIVKVLPGESVPVDGVIISGQTSVNQAVMTGESLPVDKSVGDEVSSGTVNCFGAFEMKALKVGEDSSIQRMISLVQSADVGKAKIVGIADRWATWIVVIALTASVLTWLFTGEIIRAVTILVVFCPCALVLATPTAIMAAIGNATKHGFLVKEGDALERLALVKKIAFDKTGTLTYGKLEVVDVKSVDESCSNEELYYKSACAEQFSEHPLGKAVINCYRAKFNRKLSGDDFKMYAGLGVSIKLDNKNIVAGNIKFLNKNNIEIDKVILDEAEKLINKGCTVIYIGEDNKILGYIALSDTVRNESKSMISEINSIGIEPVLLTGDNEKAATTIANSMGINEFYANCMPEDKLAKIDEYEKNNNLVCMIGDGINDAPALKKANIGIAMGGVGSDIAIDAADIAIVNDDIKELPHLLRLSKRMMVIIRCNLSFSMLLNFVAIILAITGVLNPVVGALVHNAGSVFVIINSAFLLKWRNKK